MEKKSRRHLTFSPELLDKADQLVAILRSQSDKKTDVRHVFDAALIGFFDLKARARLTLLQRAQNLSLESVDPESLMAVGAVEVGLAGEVGRRIDEVRGEQEPGSEQQAPPSEAC